VRVLRAECPANLHSMPAELEVNRHSRGESRSRQRRVAELATRQHGVVARDQLVRIGYGADAIDFRIDRGRLHVVHRGVYAAGHPGLSLRGRWMAAVLCAGPAAVLSHRSAAALWGLMKPSAHPTEVTATAERKHPGLRTHVTSLTAADRTIHDGIPVTSVARTLLDLAAVAPGRLDRALEESERLELFDLREVEELLARSRGRRGVARLRIALAVYREPVFSRSELERRFLRLVRRESLPLLAMNCNVAGHEVDALWPEEQLIVELDGYEYHRTRRAYEDDRLRDDNLALAGHDVVRLTWSRLNEPDLGDRLHAHLARRRRELGLDR
jgi:very-short-patch-repair endonuclease/predicted transcriptional regulator of viral defense system